VFVWKGALSGGAELAASFTVSEIKKHF